MPHSKQASLATSREEHAIDSTIVRAHKHAAGVKGGNQNQEALDRSRGGFSTKIHLRTNAKGYPLTFRRDRRRVDKRYDSDDIRDDLAERVMEPVVPPRSNRKTPVEYDCEAHKRHNLIERCVR
jgi:hypothetical protein